MNYKVKFFFQKIAFRRKVRKEERQRIREEKRLIREKKKAIKEADRLHEVKGWRYYVILAVDRYVVIDKYGIDDVNRKLPKGVRWNYVKIMQNCVYHTK